jgi:uroporphyrinogen decarboxylase
MTPRERVRTALTHRQPDRTPFAWNFGPTPEMARTLTSTLAAQGIDWPTLRDVVDDVRTISPRYLGPPLPPDTDAWGIGRAAQSYGDGSYDEIAHHPLAGVTDPDELDAYPWPDPALYDYEELPNQVARVDPEGRWARKLAIDACGNPFEIYTWMTGLEETMVNLLIRPEVVRTALAHITDVFAEKMRRSLAQIGNELDLIYFADDLGGQRTLLFSPETYRSVLQPFHRRLFQQARAIAPRAAVMYHSDGAVVDILDDLIDAGIDVLEAVQVDAAGMDPVRLKWAFGDRLSFHGGISVQSLLVHEDAETVFTRCRDLVATFGMGGGYIAAPTHAIQVGTPPENVLAMLRAVLGEADFDAAVRAARVPKA